MENNLSNYKWAQDVNRHLNCVTEFIKACFTSVFITEIQVKTKMEYYSTSVRSLLSKRQMLTRVIKGAEK